MVQEADAVRAWVRRILQETGLSPTALARRAALAPSTLNKFLNDETIKHCLSVTTVSKIARATGHPLPISTGDEAEPETVPVVGYVGAGATIYAIDDHALGSGLEEAPVPPDSPAGSTVALRVRGDSMAPTLQDGWIIYYSRTVDGVPPDCLGQLCVIKLANDGPTYVKYLHGGSRAGLFDLLGTTAQIMKDVRVEWAARVRWIRPG
ncbi:MAG: S24 family peptidase [Alphaproteobacteria bacterium]